MKKTILLTVLGLTITTVGLTVGANSAHADVISPQATLNQSDIVTGNVKATLNYAQAVTKPGWRAPEYDLAAKQQLSTVPTHYLGKNVSVNYSINTITGMQKVTATLLNPDDSANTITVPLNAEGLFGKYSFVGCTNTNDRIAFTMDSNFKNPYVNILVINKDEAFNSVALSIPSGI